MSAKKSYVLVVNENGDIDTTVLGETQTIPVVVDIDALETDEYEAREKLAELRDIKDSVGGDPDLDAVIERLSDIVDQFDAEEELEEEEDDDFDMEDEDDEEFEEEDEEIEDEATA